MYSRPFCMRIDACTKRNAEASIWQVDRTRLWMNTAKTQIYLTHTSHNPQAFLYLTKPNPTVPSQCIQTCPEAQPKSLVPDTITIAALEIMSTTNSTLKHQTLFRLTLNSVRHQTRLYSNQDCSAHNELDVRLRPILKYSNYIKASFLNHVMMYILKRRITAKFLTDNGAELLQR